MAVRLGLFLRGMDRGVEPPHLALQPPPAADPAPPPLPQALDRVVVGRLAAGQLDLDLFLVGLVERHLAFVDGAMQQQPRGELHQPGGEPHALGRVGECDGALEPLGFLPTGTVEIGRGLLDQRHAIAEQRRERLGVRKPFAEIDRAGFVRGIFCHTDATLRYPGALSFRDRAHPRASYFFKDAREAGGCPAGPADIVETRTRGSAAPPRRSGQKQGRTVNKKRSRRCRRLKVITGRRQTEWTGATRCPEMDTTSNDWESLTTR